MQNDSETLVLPPEISGLRILLAEDNLLNQQIALELLEEFGVRIQVANNGREAIELLHRETFDCVLMDVRMPEMDGLEATRLIRADPQFRTLPIIAMTANARAEDRDECLGAGMNDFISKPVEPAQFFRTLLKWLQPLATSPAAAAVPENAVPLAETLPLAAAQEVDTQVLTILARNDPGKIRRLGNIFLVSGLAGVQQIAVARSQGDMAALAELGHRLKSSSRSMGAAHLADLLGQLEAGAKANNVAQVAALSGEIASAWGRIETQMAAFLVERAED